MSIMTLREFEKLPDFEYYLTRKDCLKLRINNISEESDLVVNKQRRKIND